MTATTTKGFACFAEQESVIVQAVAVDSTICLWEFIDLAIEGLLIDTERRSTFEFTFAKEGVGRVVGK
jgi:hypothetical protein